MVNNKLVYGIIIVLFITLLIFLVFQNQKSRYSCSEDGCKLTPFGNFQSLSNCKDFCEKGNGVTSGKNSTQLSQNNLNIPENNGKLEPNLHSSVVDPSPVRPTPGKSPVGPSPVGPSPVGPSPVPISPIPAQKNSNNIVKKDDIGKNNINTLYINYNNVNNIKKQIENKKKSDPYFATTKQSKSVITDYDTFPYPRYFRGNPESSLPIIAEREAGWRPRHDDAYQPNVELELTPDCVIGNPSSDYIKLYKEQTYHCYDDKGNEISYYTCDPGHNCFDNDPQKCN
jgi:hypothetical protein